MTKSSTPESWRIVTLGSVAVRVMEKYEASPDLPEPWVGADHLDEGDLRIKRWSMSDDPVFPPTFKFKYPIGAVLIHSRNPKKVAIAEFAAITGEKIFALSSRDESILSPHFFAYVLQSARFEQFTDEWMTGSVNKFLNWSALEKFEFALPPIAEQQRIVGLIGAIDKAIDSYLAVPIEKLQEAMLSEFFNDPKVKFSNLTLSECADLDMGQSPPGESYNITGDGMPFLQGSAEFGIKNPKPVKWTTSPTKVAEPGDLLISVRAPVGDVNFADRKVCIGRGLARIRETDLATTSFLVLALQYAHKDLTAASGTGMFSSISGANLKKIRVKVPSKDKQQQLVHAVALLENVADSVESAVGKSRLLRRACLNEFATSETINV